jgi:hypothetical protein
MYTHIKIVGILYIVLGIYGLFGRLVVLLAMAGIAIVPGFLVGGPMMGLGASAAVGLFGLILFGITAIANVLGIVAGFGILQRKPWARVLLIILAVLMLFRSKVGIVLGVYTLWVLLREETGKYFNHRGESPFSYTW